MIKDDKFGNLKAFEIRRILSRCMQAGYNVPEIEELITTAISHFETEMRQAIFDIRHGINCDNIEADLHARGYSNYAPNKFRTMENNNAAQRITVECLHTGKARVRTHYMGKYECKNFSDKAKLLEYLDGVCAKLALMD